MMWIYSFVECKHDHLQNPKTHEVYLTDELKTKIDQADVVFGVTAVRISQAGDRRRRRRR